jgi:hypothetical protein
MALVWYNYSTAFFYITVLTFLLEEETMNFRKRYMAVGHSTATLNGKRITYCFVKILSRIPVYGIKISYNGEVVRRTLSSDLAESARLYDVIVRNLVTPCTLDDILADYCFDAGDIFVKKFFTFGGF